MNADTNIANEPVVIKDTTANPAPLGLLGFGMTTILLNIHNAGIYERDILCRVMQIHGIGNLAVVVQGRRKGKNGAGIVNKRQGSRLILNGEGAEITDRSI